VNGSPGWAVGQWAQPTANGYYPNYVVLTGGSEEGAIYSITNNSSDSLYVAGCENLAGVGFGSQLAIIPYWTLGTVFPSGTGITVSPGTTSSGRRTEIFFRDSHTYSGVLPGATYFFYNSHWRKLGASTSSNYDDVVILPDQPFIARQSNQSPTATFTASGSVVQYFTRTCLYPMVTNVVPGFTGDNLVANYHSTTQTLDQSNLSAALIASDPGANPPAINDLLFVYDNAAMIKNKSPSRIYFYNVDHWTDLSRPPYDVNRGGDPVFVPGTGVTIRRRTGTISVWVNPP
jgi:uncharacterized protein (TIGR02597 family)